MRVFPQIGAILVLGAVAVPLSARFVPGTHPWLESLGLMATLQAAGIVPAPAGQDEAAGRQGGGQGGAQGGGQGGGQPQGTPVIAAEAARLPLSDTVTAIGTARGAASVELSFGVSGRLLSLPVPPGSRIAAGDLVAELDAGAAELALSRARLVHEDAQATLDRLARLAQSGTTTSSQLQDAELALRTAELALQSAMRDLADHRLLSPVAGYVGLIEPQVGDLVTPATPITRVEDRSALILDFRVPERLAASIGPGDAVTATAVSGGEAIDGRIIAVDNRVDETSRTLRVQATIANEDDAFRAGMAFRITMEFTGPDHPAVDPLAIQWGAEGAFVWVVRAGKAMRLPIRILQRNADAVLIEAALEPGDLVVTEGVQALRPGADAAVSPPRS